MARDDGGAAGTVVVAFVLGALTGAAVALLDGAGIRGRDAAAARREGARRAGAGDRSGASGTRVRQPAEGDDLVGDRPRTRRLRAGARSRLPSGRRQRRGSVINGWSDLFLGVIAAATLVMALIQVGAIIAALRLVAPGAAGDPVGPPGSPAAHRAGADRSPTRRRARSPLRRRRRRKSID